MPMTAMTEPSLIATLRARSGPGLLNSNAETTSVAIQTTAIDPAITAHIAALKCVEVLKWLALPRITSPTMMICSMSRKPAAAVPAHQASR